MKIDPRMKKALGKLAKKEFSSVSSLLKKGAEKVLHEHGIDWRKKKNSLNRFSPENGKPVVFIRTHNENVDVISSAGGFFILSDGIITTKFDIINGAH